MLRQSLLHEQPQKKEKSDFKFSTVFLLVNGSMISFAVMNALGKELMLKPIGTVTFNEFTLVRCCFLMVLSFLLLLSEKTSVLDVNQGMRPVLLARCLLGFVAFQVTALASKLIPLSISTLINSTSPFLTAII